MRGQANRVRIRDIRDPKKQKEEIRRRLKEEDDERQKTLDELEHWRFFMWKKRDPDDEESFRDRAFDAPKEDL